MQQVELNPGRVVAARYLASPKGADLLSTADEMLSASVAPHNALIRLVGIIDPSLPVEASRQAAALAWTQATLRSRAVEKLGHEIGSAILFDSDGLQMSSGLTAARYHVELARRSGCELIVDMTAGIGGDSLAFAQAGFDVVACERDAARAELLDANVRRLQLAGNVTVRQADVLDDEALIGDDLQSACVYLDPPRRGDSGRWGNVDLAEVLFRHALRRSPGAVLMKLSPAIHIGYGALREADMEFISIGGECREALLQWGRVRADRSAAPRIGAVILPGGHQLAARNGPEQRVAVSARLDQAGYLYEPDPSVIRAGLSAYIAAEHKLAKFDADVAYLVSDMAVETHFASAYRILDAFPYHQRAVQAWLDDHGVTQLIVKKRGVPDEPESVRRLFKLKAQPGKQAPVTAILALTKQGKQRWALFLERV